MSSYIISLLQATKGIKTVKVRFSKAPNAQLYTYKTFLNHLQPGDWVVVEVRDVYSTAKVESIDDVPDVLNEDIELRWIVQHIDTSRVDQINAEQETLAKQLALSEAKRRLDEALKLVEPPRMPALEAVAPDVEG